MKRRGSSRRQVLDLDNKSESPRRTWQTKYQQICQDHLNSNGSGNNGGTSTAGVTTSIVSKNAGLGLVGYNSDSEGEDDSNKTEGVDLDAKVENFLKEIQEIAPFEPAPPQKSKSKPVTTTAAVAAAAAATTVTQTQESIMSSHYTLANAAHTNSDMTAATAPSIAWQECYDESSGYPYYWNLETNEVTWDMPAEYHAYMVAVEQWQTQQMLLSQGAMYSVQMGINSHEVGQEFHKHTEDTVLTNSDNKKDAKLKKRYKPPSSDSEDEKIEMITSYGPNSGDEDSESDEESSEKPSMPKKKMKTENFTKPKHKYSLLEVKEIKVGPQLPDDYLLEDSNSPQSLVSYGPDPGPPGAEDDNDSQSSPFGKYSLLSNVPDVGPPGDESSVNIITNGISLTLPNDTDSSEKPKENKISTDTELRITEKPAVDKSDKPVRKKVGKQGSEETEECDGVSGSDGEEPDENVILSRLRNQAKILEELGGEVPDEIKELIEQPEDNSTNDGNEIAAAMEPTSFSLIAGYGDDSEPEEEGGKPEEKQTETSKPLFPIVESEAKDKTTAKSLNLKVIKLSARAKALINASTTTAKARATDFVSTAEGLRPADVVAASEKCDSDPVTKPESSSSLPDIINKKATSRKKRLAVSISITQASSVDNSKTQSVLSTVASENSVVGPSTSTTVIADVTYPVSTWSYDTELSSGERRGFGYAVETKPNTSVSPKKGIQFVKAETLMPKTENMLPIKEEAVLPEKAYTEVEESDAKATAEAKEISQVLLEKVKFLSEGKETVPPVQAMAIQVETLVTAWEAGGLSLKYLSAWLTAMADQLASLEQAAAPLGWLCEWDRSYKRYFYRNKESGAIQWEYPVMEDEPVASELQTEEVGGGEEAMCISPEPSPPPPPYISERSHSPSPPPPPRISSPEQEEEDEPDEVQDTEETPPPVPPLSESRNVETPAPPPLPPMPPPLPPNSPPPLPLVSPPPLPPRESDEPLPPGVDLTEDYYATRPPLPPVPPPMPVPPPPPESPPPPPPPPVNEPAIEMEVANTYQMSYAVAPIPLQYDPYHMHAGADYTSGLVASQYAMSAMYTGGDNYIISRPPASTVPSAASNLATELDSFYSDLAALEPQAPPEESPLPPPEPPAPVPSPPQQQLPSPPPPDTTVSKKRKKTKLAPGLSLKKKGVSSLVAKWQQVQQDVRREATDES